MGNKQLDKPVWLLMAVLLVAVVVLTILLLLRPRTPGLRLDYNCPDFQTYAEARDIYDQYPGDPFRLDGNGDGVPCEGLPGAPR